MRPEFVYHYTSAAALQSIFKNQTLRATNLAFMNDSKEIKLGLQSVGCALRKARDNASAYPQRGQHDAIVRAANQWEESSEEGAILPEGDSNPYAVCFSARDDSLSQWRAYGRRTSNDIGVALQFLTSDLSMLTDTEFHHIHYVKDAEAGATLVPKWVDLLNPDIGPKPEHGTMGSPFNPERWLWWQKVRAAIWIKDAAFEDEEEYRLVAHRWESDVGYRPSQFGFTPYVDIDISQIAIQSVRIGPTPHSAVATQAVRSFLRSLSPGRPHPPVTVSSAPFRDW